MAVDVALVPQVREMEVTLDEATAPQKQLIRIPNKGCFAEHTGLQLEQAPEQQDSNLSASQE